MLKHLSISAALIAFATAPANAQQEAILQKVEVRGTAFDIAVAIPKAHGVKFDLGKTPEALVVHLIGGELALWFESHEAMLKALEWLRQPVGSFRAEGKPVALYSVPKAE